MGFLFIFGTAAKVMAPEKYNQTFYKEEVSEVGSRMLRGSVWVYLRVRRRE